MASESQYCGALDRRLHDIVVRVTGAGHMCVGVLMCTRERVQRFYRKCLCNTCTNYPLERLKKKEMDRFHIGSDFKSK